MSNKKKALNCDSLAHSTESQVIHSQLPLSEAEAHRQKKNHQYILYTKKKIRDLLSCKGKKDTFEYNILLRSSMSAFFFCSSLS